MRKRKETAAKPYRRSKRTLYREWQGSYTVEASLIMGVVVMLILFMIYMGFYRYDRVAVLSECYQQALTLSWEPEKISGNWKETVEDQLLGASGVIVTRNVDQQQAVAGIYARLLIPYINRVLTISHESLLSVERPVSAIRTLRNLQNIWEEVTP